MSGTRRGLAAHTRAVRQYYNQNTSLFLRFGSSPAAQTIHRAVWADEATSLPDALNYSNQLLVQQAQALQASLSLQRLQIVDLGCGVGASLSYMAERLDTPFLAVGLTLSGVQAQLAGKNASRDGYTKNITFAEADFLHVPLASGFHLAFSIEAFAHASNPDAYLGQVWRLLVRGGRLAMCDDFLDEAAAGDLVLGSRLWLQAYQEGWHVPNLLPASSLQQLAADHGLRLVENRELTPYLRRRALPERLARLLLYLGRRMPQRHAILPSMLGSLALQQCLHIGIIRYHWMVFEKVAG